eukprot:scaffold10794_cov119-Isochrysis_galbana.AAC.5
MPPAPRYNRRRGCSRRPHISDIRRRLSAVSAMSKQRALVPALAFPLQGWQLRLAPSHRVHRHHRNAA